MIFEICIFAWRNFLLFSKSHCCSPKVDKKFCISTSTQTTIYFPYFYILLPLDSYSFVTRCVLGSFLAWLRKQRNVVHPPKPIYNFNIFIFLLAFCCIQLWYISVYLSSCLLIYWKLFLLCALSINQK